MHFADQNIENLSSQLTDKEEEIEVLSSRVEELMETEVALKTTMDSADDMIAAREQEHLDEVEKLKNGLKRWILLLFMINLAIIVRLLRLGL